MLLPLLLPLTLTLPLLIHASPFPHPPLSKRVASAVYTPGGLSTQGSGAAFLSLDSGVQFILQYTDANLVVYENSVPKWAANTEQAGGCLPNGAAGPNLCTLNFQTDGNLVFLYNGVPKWASGTATSAGFSAAQLYFTDQNPWIFIVDAYGRELWSTVTKAAIPGGPPPGTNPYGPGPAPIGGNPDPPWEPCLTPGGCCTPGAGNGECGY
ncbi:hypothetical protein MMC32_006668 [Xylographa parallela]|nr:hypothetical protein [Xylographa parallela]